MERSDCLDETILQIFSSEQFDSPSLGQQGGTGRVTSDIRAD